LATATNASANGLVVLIEKSDWGAPDLSGVPDSLANYVTGVAIPLAESMPAAALLCGYMNLSTDGSVPGTTGYFPALNTYGVVLAMDFGGGGSTPLRIINIEVTPDGVKLQWTPLTQKTYAVEAEDSLASTFKTLAGGLTTSEYVDASAKAASVRYYRVRAQ
jgi:hypothetical protein